MEDAEPSLTDKTFLLCSGRFTNNSSLAHKTVWVSPPHPSRLARMKRTRATPLSSFTYAKNKLPGVCSCNSKHIYGEVSFAENQGTCFHVIFLVPRWKTHEPLQGDGILSVAFLKSSVLLRGEARQNSSWVQGSGHAIGMQNFSNKQNETGNYRVATAAFQLSALFALEDA